MDQVPSAVVTTLAIRSDKRDVVFSAIDLPDDIVSGDQPPQGPIESRESRAQVGIDLEHVSCWPPQVSEIALVQPTCWTSPIAK